MGTVIRLSASTAGLIIVFTYVWASINHMVLPASTMMTGLCYMLWFSTVIVFSYTNPSIVSLLHMSIWGLPTYSKDAERVAHWTGG
jgi:hypothetical protein